MPYTIEDLNGYNTVYLRQILVDYTLGKLIDSIKDSSEKKNLLIQEILRDQTETTGIKKGFSFNATSLADDKFQLMKGGSHKRKHAHAKSNKSRKTKSKRH